MNTAYDRLRDRVAEVTGHTARSSARGAMLRCPAHEDRSPSLSVRAVDDRVLVHCFGGCAVDEVLAAVGWVRRDLFDDPRHGGSRLRREIVSMRRVGPDPDPSWTYVTEPPDVPDAVRVAIAAAETLDFELAATVGLAGVMFEAVCS